MSLKKSLPSNWKLYCIIDKNVIKKQDPVKAAERVFCGGADILQLRYKNCPSYKLVPIARQIARLAKKHKKKFLINDRPDVALASGADGVHLGSGDMSVAIAKRLLSGGIYAGKTVHSIKETCKARREAVDYISAGPVFSTPLKKHLGGKGVGFVKKVKEAVRQPVFAIGGINNGNVEKVLKSGVNGVCVARAA